jgi:hypothetical protein
MKLGVLKTQFKGLLNNTVVSNNPTLVSTFIDQSIMRIQRELRVPFMEKQILYTIPEGWNGKLSIPSDLLALKGILVDADGDGINEYELNRRDLSTVIQASQNPGHPSVYARQGGAWILGRKPGPGDQILIYYYAEFAALADDNAENTCLKVAWDAVLNGALSNATDYLDDDRVERFEKRYLQITQQLQEQADADELTANAAISPALRYEDEGGW